MFREKNLISPAKELPEGSNRQINMTLHMHLYLAASVMLWGLSKMQRFRRRQRERKLDACPSFPSLRINTSTCARRRKQEDVRGGNLFTIYRAAARFHWQLLEVAHKKSACNSVIDDDLTYENEHIQTFHKERMNSQY